MILNRISKDFNLPLDVYIRVKQSMGYENKKELVEINKFVNDLPHKLKVEVSLYIYESRYTKI